MNDEQQVTQQNQKPAIPSPPLRSVIADDHAIVRQGIRSLLESEPGIRVVGEAMSGKQAEHIVARLVRQSIVPNVVIMDISMSGGNGGEALVQIRLRFPQVKVLMLSMHEDISYLQFFMRHGASGYVLKRSAAATLIHAIRVVATGVKYIDPALTTVVVQGVFATERGSAAQGSAAQVSLKTCATPDTKTRGVKALSSKEDATMRHIAKGLTNKEIGVQLGVSVKTIETYKARSMEKLQLNGRSELMRYAMAQGWLTD